MYIKEFKSQKIVQACTRFNCDIYVLRVKTFHTWPISIKPQVIDDQAL